MVSPSKIRLWQFHGITLELRDNPTGQLMRLPRHSHPQYQIIVAQNMTARYGYRGGSHLAPPGSLVILHPDEVHSAQGCDDAQPLTPLRTFLVPPDFFGEVVAEAKPAGLPFFPQPVLRESGIVSLLLRLHQALETSAATLEKDVLALSAFARLSLHHAASRPLLRPAGRERGSVRRVREYLEDRYAENVPLTQLADLAGLSPFYLCRVFSQEVGLPPQVYQAQVRIERAKALLVQGHSIGDVSMLTGFADQSHFTRQFKKRVGVTPGRYVHHL